MSKTVLGVPTGNVLIALVPAYLPTYTPVNLPVELLDSNFPSCETMVAAVSECEVSWKCFQQYFVCCWLQLSQVSFVVVVVVVVVFVFVIVVVVVNTVVVVVVIVVVVVDVSTVAVVFIEIIIVVLQTATIYNTIRELYFAKLSL